MQKIFCVLILISTAFQSDARAEGSDFGFPLRAMCGFIADVRFQKVKSNSRNKPKLDSLEVFFQSVAVPYWVEGFTAPLKMDYFLPSLTMVGYQQSRSDRASFIATIQQLSDAKNIKSVACIGFPGSDEIPEISKVKVRVGTNFAEALAKFQTRP